MKAFKAFIKPFEVPKRSVKIKIQLNFYFNTTFRNARDAKCPMTMIVDLHTLLKVRMIELQKSLKFLRIIWLFFKINQCQYLELGGTSFLKKTSFIANDKMNISYSLDEKSNFRVRIAFWKDIRLLKIEENNILRLTWLLKIRKLRLRLKKRVYTLRPIVLRSKSRNAYQLTIAKHL